MDAPDAPNLSSLLALAFSAGVAALVALFEKRKAKRIEPADDTGAARVVAATFTERGQMDRLTAALVAVERAVLSSTERTVELIGLLKAEAHRRELEAEVRQALKDRGIIER